MDTKDYYTLDDTAKALKVSTMDLINLGSKKKLNIYILVGGYSYIYQHIAKTNDSYRETGILPNPKMLPTWDFIHESMASVNYICCMALEAGQLDNGITLGSIDYPYTKHDKYYILNPDYSEYSYSKKMLIDPKTNKAPLIKDCTFVIKASDFEDLKKPKAKIPINTKRDDDFLIWFKDTQKAKNMSKRQIEQALMAINANLWSHNFDDWWKDSKVRKDNYGEAKRGRPTTKK